MVEVDNVGAKPQAALLDEPAVAPGASADLIPDALDLAMQFDRTVYDSLYVVLAVKTNSVMISGDRQLVNALTDTPLEKHVAWIGDNK